MTSRVMKRAAARLPVRITRIFGRKDERARIGGIDFGHKGKVEKPAEKAGAKVSPNTAAAAAHSLRSALGLRTDPVATDQIAMAPGGHGSRGRIRVALREAMTSIA